MDDVVIIGGGIIGASAAYFLSDAGRKVKVIEKDPTYKKASFPLSLGGFRRQFFQRENIMLGKFAREFLLKLPESIFDKFPDLSSLSTFVLGVSVFLSLALTNGDFSGVFAGGDF